MSATSHRERRGAHVNYYREKSQCFTCKTCHPGYLRIMKSFSLFFPCGGTLRGDTISTSRSAKAVINFVIATPPPRTHPPPHLPQFLFFFFCLSRYETVLCVCLSKVNYNDMQKGERIHGKDHQVGETCRALLFIRMSWIYRYCLKPGCEALPF